MYQMALAALLSSALSCASASLGGDDGSAQREPDAAFQTITAAPTTMRVELDDATRQALEGQLAAGSLRTARLIIRDVRPHAAHALKGVRIFIESPGADTRTPADDPHHAGSFVLGIAPPESVLLNIAPTLSTLWDSGELSRVKLDQSRAIRITFVPEPWDFAARLPGDFALTVQSVAIEVPPQP